MKILVFAKKYRDIIENFLKEKNHEINMVDSISSFWKTVEREEYRILIIEDIFKETIKNTTQKLKDMDPRVEIIFIGENENSKNAITTLKYGAFAYIEMPLHINLLHEMVEKIKDVSQIKQKTGKLEKQLYAQYLFAGRIIGHYPKMLEIYSFIRRIAPYKIAVLITGETGTGKDLIARAIHDLSPWTNLPFFICNCSAFTDTLLESELFGHEKGSFTDAMATKKGIFEIAEEGTVFLDEIGDMSPKGQADLLRVLENGEFRRVGGIVVLKADCRIIAATNRDLEEEVKQGRFRKDLYYRLNSIEIKMPPLRERNGDVKFLCNYFIEKFNKKYQKNVKGISVPAQKIFFSYNWPGNVRELENVIERAMISSAKNFIGLEDLPQISREKDEQKEEDFLTLQELEKKHIEIIINSTNWHKTKTAKILGISRRALERKIEKYKLKNLVSEKWANSISS